MVASECILWDGYVNTNGYGVIYSNSTGRPAHRVAYERVHGQVGSGDHVHHKCGTRLCVNVSHLEAMSAGDHTREHRPHLCRPRTKIRDFCESGHDLTGERARYTDGKCRICHKQRSLKRYWRLKREVLEPVLNKQHEGV